jgi:NAD(P)-dependent dehydrogenase (short-subunit alcohol dehydrogenase family)
MASVAVSPEDRVVIVTGGANGIGKAISLAFAGNSAQVVVLDIDASKAEQTVLEVDAISGVRGHACVVDMADHDGVRDAIKEVATKYGRLDVLVNNAATFEPDIQASDVDVETTPIETWDRTMAVNLRGPMVACKYAIPEMMKSGRGGVIVNISSTAAYNGDVVHLAYSASKAGLHALTRSIATTHGMKGIRCNTVATGLILTSNAAEAVAAEKLAAYRRNRLVDEVGTPAEVASLVTYLTSDAARYIQGQAIVMDGGATAHQPWHSLSHILHPEVVGTEPV